MMIQVTPVIDYTVRGLCARPYPLHPKGCPNVGKSERCPPIAPFFDRVFDISSPVYAVVTEFDLAAHVTRMQMKHPTWSDRQLRCVLYWQAGARKRLTNAVIAALKRYPGWYKYQATLCPEGMGVNVTETLAGVGIILEWPPEHIARQVALLGKPLPLA